MGQRLATLVLLTAPLGGCSLLYDPAGLPPATDAPVPPRDVARFDLTLTDVRPSVVLEGQGDGGSRAAIVVIRGSNIAPDATVDIRPATGQATFTVGAPVVASDFSLMAVPLTIPADKMLAGDVPLDITVTQPAGDGTTVSQPLVERLTLRGLPELDADTIQAPGNVADTMQLQPLYSKIDLSQSPSISWVGTRRVELRATASITVGNLQANGGNANGSTAGVGGPGGCRGGGPAQKGLCDGGGGPGNSGELFQAGGGGGAGFADMGSSGEGNGPGVPGPRVGSPLIATYEGFQTFTASKASGGGGGGNIGAGMGAAGGGGGGVLELTAGGDIRAGTLTAAGGNGGTLNLQGSGGGGAGGVVMVRSGGVMMVGAVDVSGGLGGTGAPRGGAGAAGRVRWDAPASAAQPPPAMVGAPHRGPAYAMDTPMIFDQDEPSITLYGTANDAFEVHVTDQEGTQRSGGNATFTGTAVTIKPTLQHGYNLVCITVEGGQKGTPEADKCIEVAFLP